MGADVMGRQMSSRPATFSLRVGAQVRGRAGRWAGGGGELALRNDHNALERIKSIKIAILGRHQEASASVRKHFQPS